MIQFRRLRRLDKTPIRLLIQPATRRVQRFSNRTLHRAVRVMGPTLVALTFASVAHAQGTMDFSGAQTLMGTFRTSLYTLIREKSFPPPVRLGPRAVAWVRSEVRQWAVDRVHASRSAA